MKAQSDKSLITLKNVYLTREGEKVFNNISLEISESRVGVIGNNGSGKSSLARLMNGLIQADSGEIIVHGINASIDADLLPQIVGFL